MRLAIDHTTHYRFTGPVSHGLQRLRLTPRTTAGQTVASWNLHLDGARTEVEYDDENGNRVTLISFVPGANEVSIRCEGLIDTIDQAGIVGRHTGFLPLWHFRQPTPLTKPGPRLRSLLGTLQAGDDRLATLHALSTLVLDVIEYAPGHTDATTGSEGALAAGRGVCQDHAHVFITAARALGIPARYVSGYLLMKDRVEQDAGHAWAEAHVDGLGWVGFDIANAICPDSTYVRVAAGRDYKEAAPLTGMRYGAHDESMHVTLAVGQQQVEQ
jgi:transglutaminase-like putative cysteine protease